MSLGLGGIFNFSSANSYTLLKVDGSNSAECFGFGYAFYLFTVAVL